MSIKYYTLSILLLLNTPNIQSQTIQTENLFEFYRGYFQKNVRISQRIVNEWYLNNSSFQTTHYNVNKDIRIISANSITRVSQIYYKRNSDFPNVLDLVDDGRHFDNGSDDGIYGNYLNDNISEFKTDEAIGK